jgi:ATP/maltotriose-dependent transcriptional regulator MalT
MESASEASAALTSREAQVLWHLAQGCTYERIGDRLGVSLHTVTTHIKNIYRKLDVHCAAAAVRRGIELRLLGGGQHVAG